MNALIPARHEAVLRNQDRLFRTLLRTVWQKSAFYREYYFDHGIREHQLAELGVSALPFITKKILMENFDRVVTDARLRKSQIERWLNDVRDPRQLFHGDFIVILGFIGNHRHFCLQPHRLERHEQHHGGPASAA